MVMVCARDGGCIDFVEVLIFVGPAVGQLETVFTTVNVAAVIIVLNRFEQVRVCGRRRRPRRLRTSNDR